MIDTEAARSALGECEVEVAVRSDVGTERAHNEDCCGTFAEHPACLIAAVADGVSGSEGGEVASQMAVEGLIQAYRDGDQQLAAGTRLYRAVQDANIAIYDRAVAVPELRGMSTTLTAVAVEQGELTVVHVGDSRLYLIRRGAISQLTKDHTVTAEKVRMGLVSKDKARTHADRSVLTRCVGRELIVNRDRAACHLSQGDVLLLCSDGLYNVLPDQELARLISGQDASGACRALVERANSLGTADNLTAVVVRVVGPVPAVEEASGWGARLRRVLGRKG